MLIIEGSDNVGKTTAAKRFCEMFSEYTYQHATKPSSKRFEPHWIQDKTVWDRWIFGRIMYGNLFQCHPVTPFNYLEKVLKDLLKKPHIIVFMYHSDDDAYNRNLRQSSRSQMYTLPVLRAVNQIWKNWRILFSNVDSDVSSNLNIIDWDITTKHYPVLTDLDKWYRQIDDRTTWVKKQCVKCTSVDHYPKSYHGPCTFCEFVSDLVTLDDEINIQSPIIPVTVSMSLKMLLTELDHDRKRYLSESTIKKLEDIADEVERLEKRDHEPR